MSDTPNRVALDRVDWLSVLPVLRLARALRNALQPSKLVVALLAVVLIHGCGVLLDAVAGEPEQVGSLHAGDDSIGVYRSFMITQSQAFDLLVDAAIGLRPWLSEGESGVFEALSLMFAKAPVAYFNQHPWFMLCFGLITLAIVMGAGGIICRMAASQVCHGTNSQLPQAFKFVTSRWGWFLLTPMMPTLLILLFGGVLIAGGFVFFNAAVLEVVGAVLYGPMLVLGLVIGLVTLLLILSLLLMVPAMSVEGTDGFDVISRVFNYVLYKPWQYAGYLFASVLYFAAVFVIVSAIAGLTLGATNHFIGIGAISELDAGWMGEITRHEAILSEGDLAREAGSDSLVYAQTIVGWWHDVLYAVVGAVLFSLLCCMQTQVYVLMRKSADGTPLDDCAADEDVDPWSSPADLVDPKAQAIAEAGPGASVKPQDSPAKPASED